MEPLVLVKALAWPGDLILSKASKEFPMEATWMPHEKHGALTARSDLPQSVYAFPKQRKEPMTDAQHVRNAVARFDQVIGVSDEDRALAFANIEKAAKYYNVNLSETSWHDLGVHPQENREESAAKGVATKRERGELEEAAAKGAATRKREREEQD
jgi:hypothetical protein